MSNLRKAQASIIVSGMVSFALLMIKAVAGLLTGSVVLLSDALDSFADFLSMIGSYVGIRISRKKPSSAYNYGYGKAENVASLIISMLIIFASISIAKMGYDSFFFIQEIENSIIAYGAAIASIISSAGLSIFLFKKSNELGSELLLINSKERLADVFRGMVVFASIYLNQIGNHYAQGVVAIIICFAVFFIGIKSLALSVRGLMDGSPDKKMIGEILDMIKRDSKVLSFKNLRLKKSGSYVFGDVEICVDKKCSISEAHSIADSIEKKIKSRFSQIASFIIHVEPYK
ncbi:MAG: cation diffusion facilitator family transporter [Candidatus Nanoarchaeia archaeon]|nr:cation diffusion facilitator family transporter [Candidatus Nanoarchaeia archaeon]MDD5499318.1 cation diffusion facilitator family transporter [Candidatus Nanoarchaeia archaeon]